MHEQYNYSVDPYLKYAITVFCVIFGLIFLVKKTAYKYFVILDHQDSPNCSSIDTNSSCSMPGFVSSGKSCVVCGSFTTKHCSRCKSVQYCSESCQKSHWHSGHKDKCEDFRLSCKSRLQGRQNSTAVALGPGTGTSNQIKKILFPYDKFVELFNWNNQGFPPCGLLNCGNSCFANVVLQCLAYTRPLAACLLEKGHRSESNFSELASPTKDRVTAFLGIPASERTFRPLSKTTDSGSQETSSAMSGSVRSSARFSLQELEGDIPIKQEKTTLTVAKARAPNTRSSNKKRKTTEVIEVEDSPLHLDFNEAWQHLHLGLEQISKAHKEKIAEKDTFIDEMKKLAALRTKAMDEDVAKIAKLEKQLQDQAMELQDQAMELESLKEKHSAEVKGLIDESRENAKELVLEIKIKMAKEAKTEGFNISAWDVDQWEKKLAELKGVVLADAEEEKAVGAEAEMKEAAGDSLGNDGTLDQAWAQVFETF